MTYIQGSGRRINIPLIMINSHNLEKSFSLISKINSNNDPNWVPTIDPKLKYLNN